jgi:membrane protein implicated in regulation of membrane protease activity
MPDASQMVNIHGPLFYVLVVGLLAAIPTGMILKRLGLSTAWAFLCFIPIAALFGLWLLAFIRWPRDPQP